MTSLNFEDFYKVPEIKFDISKLRKDLDAILEKKRFNSPGVTHFGAIPLNQIPNDEESIREITLEEDIGLLLMRQEKKFQETLILTSQNILN